MLKLLKFVPVQLVFFLIIGILISNYFDVSTKLLIEVLFGLILLLIIVHFCLNKQYRTPLLFNLITYSITIVIGMTSFSSQTELNHKSHYSNMVFHKDSINELGVTITKNLKENAYSFRYEANIFSLNSLKTKGKLLINIKKDCSLNKLNVNDKLFIKTKLEDISVPKNPGEFNYKKYLKNQQIYHQLRITKADFIRVRHNEITIKGVAANIRNKIYYSLHKNGFKENELAVINALLLGHRQTVDNDLLENYANAGAIHILAVSGLHIGIILIILQFLLSPLRTFKKGKFIITAISLILLWMYAALAGFSPSIVRAVTMFSALAIGMALNKPSNTYNSLFISMFILLLIHPFYIFEVGFQLSYLAVFFIVWVQPIFSSFWKPKYKVLNYFWQLLTVSLAAQLGVGLLSIYYFHQFPGLFFISNLVIIPVLGLILILGIAVITLSLLNVLPNMVAESYMFIIKAMNSFVSFVGEQESFIAKNISISLMLLLVSYGAIIFFILWIETNKFKRLIIFLSFLFVISIINIYEKHSIETSNKFIVFHKNAESLIGIKKGDKTVFHSSKETNSESYLLKNYLISERINNVKFTKENSYLFNFEETKILIIDEKELFEFKTIKPSIIILKNSPKINLERVIQLHKPSRIIADGSNYTSFIENWRMTCLKRKTPFHSTLQKGAYIIKN
jgi:competence protein ComEC